MSDIATEPVRPQPWADAKDMAAQAAEGVPQRTVTPDPADLERIARERELVRAAKARRIDRQDLLSEAIAGFQWPAIGLAGRITPVVEGGTAAGDSRCARGGQKW